MDDLDRLNHILAELQNAPSESRRMLIEHLEGARFYLTGAMPEEFAFNLRMAEQSLDTLSDTTLKSQIQEFIDAHRSEV